MDPVTLLGILGSLASIVSFVEKIVKQGRTLDKEATHQMLLSAEKASALLASNKRAIAMVSKLSVEIREAIEERITKRKTDIIHDITDNTLSPRQQHSQIEAAKSDICRMLEYLRGFNRGVLPKEFEPMWEEMGCIKTAN